MAETCPTEQSPEYAMEIGRAVADRVLAYPSELREWREVRWETPDRDAVAGYVARIIVSSTAVKELVGAAKDAEESLRHAIEDMKADGVSGWKLEMRQERLVRLQSALKPFQASTGGE